MISSTYNLRKQNRLLHVNFFLQVFYFTFFLIILNLFTGCSSSSKLNFISRNDWNASDPKPYKKHVPIRITIHHEGTFFNPAKETAIEHIKKVQTWGMGTDRNWSDIPYHYIIDFDGNIIEGRDVYTAGETATDYNPEGHLLITCIGNFEEQELTELQLEALINMIAYCCNKYQISPETIKAHKDYTATLCPGKNLYKYLENGFIIEKVKERLEEMK
jgi:hypothetical protein